MKKFKFALFALLLIPCALLIGCGVDTTYTTPLVTVDKIVTSDVQTAINKSAMSVVSVWTRSRTTAGEEVSTGSGVIYQLDKEKGDAIIITNYHVLYDTNIIDAGHISGEIWVELYGSESTTVANTMNGVVVQKGAQAIDVKFIGGSLSYDLALLKVENSNVLKESYARAVEFSPTQPHLGQTAIAIGNPLGYGISATTGIISVESEYIMYNDFYNVVVRVTRTDAAINGGNSGGGLFDEQGRLLGIVNAGMDNSQGMNSAIPVSLVKSVINNILHGYNTNSYKGTSSYQFGLEYEPQNSKGIYDENTGLVYIREDIIVTKAVGASKAFDKGDKIVSAELNGVKHEFSRAFEIDEFLLKIRAGDTFKMTCVTTGGLFTHTFTANSNDFELV